MKDGFPVSIAELLAAGERPLPSEAVAIVLDVCQQVMRQPAGGSVLPPITTSALFLDGSGGVALAGGVPVEDDQTVPLLGRLLLQMLPATGTPGSLRVPARLRKLASRAASGELANLSVGRLAASLRRFAPEQHRAAIRGVFERWRAVKSPRRPVTPSEVGIRGVDGPAGDAAADVPRRSWLVPRSATTRRLAVGGIVTALLMLAGAGAAYWLNADEKLPPVPLNPGILLSEPPPAPRTDWELLADPDSNLSVRAQPGRSPGESDEGAARQLPTRAAEPGQKPASVPPAARRSLHRPQQ